MKWSSFKLLYQHHFKFRSHQYIKCGIKWQKSMNHWDYFKAIREFNSWWKWQEIEWNRFLKTSSRQWQNINPSLTMPYNILIIDISMLPDSKIVKAKCKILDGNNNYRNYHVITRDTWRMTRDTNKDIREILLVLCCRYSWNQKQSVLI